MTIMSEAPRVIRKERFRADPFNEAPALISESERLWIADKNDPKTRRLAAMMVATMLAGSHYTEPCVAEDKQITNAVRVALKIIRAVDEAA